LHVGGIFEYLGLENRTGYGEYEICPPIPVINDNGSILTTTSIGTLQWYENGVLVPGATSQTFEINPLEYGVYAVTVTVSGCTIRSEDFTYLITQNEISQQDEVQVYPNPVNDELTVYLPAASEAVNFTFMDMMGRSVKNLTGHGPEHHISLRDFETGPYLLSIETKGKKQVRKIIKLN